MVKEPIIDRYHKHTIDELFTYISVAPDCFNIPYNSEKDVKSANLNLIWLQITANLMVHQTNFGIVN